MEQVSTFQLLIRKVALFSCIYINETRFSLEYYVQRLTFLRNIFKEPVLSVNLSYERKGG